MADFDYVLKRSSRRTISIRITDNNEIVVTAPYRTSIVKIESFLRSKSSWIARHLKVNSDRNSKLSNVLAFKTVLVKGEERELVIGERSSFTDDKITVPNLSKLKKVFCDNFEEEFLQVFERISFLCSLRANSVKFRDYKSRWGCCDKLGNIVFSYKLLMLPENLWEYVILHELCHTVHMNHSAAFYALLSSFMPDYKLRQRQLKTFAALSRLY